MGCWNETCGITNLPILSDQPVRLFLLVGVADVNEGHAGHCYSNDQWTPRFMAIKGKYDDYGGLEDIQEDWNTRWIISELRDAITEVRLRTAGTINIDNPYAPRHNDLDLGGELYIDDILRAIHEDSLWIPGLYDNAPLGWMMVHEWAYQRLTLEMDRDWRGKMPLAEVVENGRDWYTKLAERLADSPGKFDFILNMDVVDWKNPFAFMNDRARGLDGHGAVRGIGGYRDLVQQLASQDRSVDDADVMAVITALAEHVTFVNNMSLLRRAWRPQTGKGSQCESMEIHRDLALLTAQHAQERINEFEYEEEEECQS